MSPKSTAQTQSPCTVVEYLALERGSETRHEYSAGEIIAHAGASRAHNLIALNVAAELRAGLKGSRCEAYIGDMRVRTSPAQYVYPDVVVVCEEPRFEDEEFDTLLNPTVLIEILSPSTEARDRGDKLHEYASVESVKDYLLIAQDRMRVDHCIKQGGSEWKVRSYSEPNQKIRIDSLACELVLADIFARVQFAKAH